MMKLVKIFLMYTFMMIVSVNLSAATAESEVACGMSNEVATNAGGASYQIVEKESMKICEDDISFNVLYILWHQVFEAEDISAIFEDFIVVSPATKEFAYSTGIGDSIMSLFQSLTVIIVSLAVVLVSFSVGKVIYKTQTSGEFMGDQHAKVFPVIFLNLSMILLITPIGPLLVIQLIMLALAVFGIMLGNYFWSSFLHSTQVKATEAVLSPEIMISQSEGIASEFISTAACMQRTNQYILNHQYVNKSDYEENMFSIDHDLEDSFKRVEHCLQYYVVPTINKDTLLDGYTFKRPDILTCDGKTISETVANGVTGAALVNLYEAANTYVYDNVDYGKEHNCGSITYTNPSIADLDPKENNKLLKKYYIGNSVRAMLDDVIDKVSVKREFNEFSSRTRSTITKMVEEGGVTDTTRKDLYAFYDLALDAKVEEIKLLLALEDEQLEDPKLAGKYTYLKATAVLNQLLGSKYVKGTSIKEDIFNAIRSFTVFRDDSFKHKGMDTYIENGRIRNVSDIKYGVEVLMNQSKLIYDYLEQSHCASKWLDLKISRRTVVGLKDGFDSGDDVFDILKLIKNKPNFECVKITGYDGDYKVNYNVDGVSDTEKYADISVESDSLGNRTIVAGTVASENILAIQTKMSNSVFAEKQAKAKIEKYLLEGYIYFVKMAVSKALTSQLKQSQDTNLLERMRQQGWATSGSMMLQITMDQGNATVFKNGLMKTGMVQSEIYPQAGGDTFSNENDILVEKGENETNGEFEELTKMNISGFLYPGRGISDFTSKENIEQSQENQMAAVVDGFFATVEEQLFSPIIYIKQASGISQGTTLTKGLEECRDTNKVCLSQDTHPLNALMMFGQDLMANAIIILIIDLVVKILTLIVDQIIGDGEEAGTNDGKNKKGKFSDIMSGFKSIISLPFKGILTALKVINVVMDIITPIAYLFLFSGVFLGFIMPTIPYISFAIVFLGWIILIFQMMVVSPIYILMAFLDGNAKNQVSFSKLWELGGGILLKPALLTISLIFGWTLSSISLYYVNSTIFSLFQATKPDSVLLGLIFTALIYVVYISLVYIVIYHSFKVIVKLPDEILQLLNVRGSNDSGFVDSLGVEKFLQARVMSDLVTGVHSAGKGKYQGEQQKREYQREEDKKNKLDKIRQEQMEKNKSSSN